MTVKDLKPGGRIRFPEWPEYKVVEQVVLLKDTEDIPLERRGKLLIVTTDSSKYIINPDTKLISFSHSNN